MGKLLGLLGVFGCFGVFQLLCVSAHVEVPSVVCGVLGKPVLIHFHSKRHLKHIFLQSVGVSQRKLDGRLAVPSGREIQNC